VVAGGILLQRTVARRQQIGERPKRLAARGSLARRQIDTLKDVKPNQLILVKERERIVRSAKFDIAAPSR